jgi:hypothetical protein
MLSSAAYVIEHESAELLLSSSISTWTSSHEPSKAMRAIKHTIPERNMGALYYNERLSFIVSCVFDVYQNTPHNRTFRPAALTPQLFRTRRESRCMVSTTRQLMKLLKPIALSYMFEANVMAVPVSVATAVLKRPLPSISNDVPDVGSVFEST